MSDHDTTPSAPQAGWYDDSNAPGYQRYWDGVQWTAHTQPAPPQVQQAVPRGARAQAKADKAYAKAQRPWYKKKRIMLPLGLFLLVGFGGALGETDDANDATAASAETDAANEASEQAQGSEKPGNDVPATEEATADVLEEPVADSGDVPATEEAVAEAPVADSEDEPEGTGIGSEARDGKFAFTVAGIECGRESIGESFIEEKAQGQYCLLDVTVENIGNEAQYLFADNQYIYDTEDRKFSADSWATAMANEDSSFFIDEINPGNSLSGVIVFDVPQDIQIVRAELHDSAFSEGIQVLLR